MRYRTLVADPPWDHSDGTGLRLTQGFGTNRTAHQNPERTAPPYPSLNIETIANLPVGDLAEKDAHLYLWTTNRYLRHVWDIAEAWGFSGICVLTWCKPPHPSPLGGTFKSNTEFCLFAKRGNCPAHGTAEGRWFLWSRRRGAPVALGKTRTIMHSAKPEAFLDLVESVSPGPYLELFARRQRLGWDTWGNEALEHVQVTA